jgi:hypothetical protein
MTKLTASEKAQLKIIVDGATDGLANPETQHDERVIGWVAMIANCLARFFFVHLSERPPNRVGDERRFAGLPMNASKSGSDDGKKSSRGLKTWTIALVVLLAIVAAGLARFPPAVIVLWGMGSVVIPIWETIDPTVPRLPLLPRVHTQHRRS